MTHIDVGMTRADLVAPFREAVRRSIVEGGEVGLQVAVYHSNQLVVDINAGIADPSTGRLVAADTLFPTFSVIKAVTAVALHIQAARGLVEYDAPVARYWPEFAANGKEKVTVRQVLQHRSGVWQMPEDVTPERLASYDWMVDAIARLKPMFEPGTRNGYQSYSFGWMVAEVVRRTDPAHRPFNDFVQQEIVRPLGISDIWIGLPASQHHRIARLIDAPPRDLPPDAPPFKAIPLHVGTREEIFGRTDVREGCIPGAGGLATARDMARFFAMLANGGELDGVRLLPEALVRTFSEPRADWDKPDDVHGIPLRIGLGFWTGGNTQPANLGRQIGNNTNAIGHPGAGGSSAWADPDKRIAVSIAHNRMFVPPNASQDPIRAAITAAFGAS
jgi:CubicO group peptidase (beta-lactamase class C family)